MAKLVTKFKYLKPSDNTSIGNYARYIATREGVDKVDDSKKNLPATQKQKDLIEKLLADFPDSEESLEYEDYKINMTIGNASEFITRTLEDNVSEIEDGKSYADYIATRPRTERFGSHGLFTDDGEAIILSNVSKELNEHQGNVWTAIISLRREDAERLGYDNGKVWRDMLRSHADELAKNMKIDKDNFHWYAAFHNESHHPHVHLIMYSTMDNEGYLTAQGIHNMRSAFGKDIFFQDLFSVYEEQTKNRDDTKGKSKEYVESIIENINNGSYENSEIERLLVELSSRLKNVSGKKVYGYLKADIKDIIDKIVDELEKEEGIHQLYNAWYERKEDTIRIYHSSLPQRIPLSQNKEFKSIKNMIIQEALNLYSIKDDDAEFDDETIEEESTDTDDENDDYEYTRLNREAEKGNMYSQYRLGKLLLDPSSSHYDTEEALYWFEQSAKQGYDISMYRLGKLFLLGEEVDQDLDSAYRWLSEASDKNNSYAQYLLGKSLLRGNYFEQDIVEGVELLMKAVDNSNKYAMYTLGKAFLDGILVLQDIDVAVKLLSDSAQRGFTQAKYIYAKLLCQGVYVPKDIEKAIALLKSASDDNSYASYLLGKIYMTEKGYVNPSLALKYFGKASDENNPYAQFQIGKMYMYGFGVEQNRQMAEYYFKLSADNGNEYAEQALKNMKNNRNWYASMSSFRLYGYMTELFRKRFNADRQRQAQGFIDRKTRQKINDKKIAHGLKQSM